MKSLKLDYTVNAKRPDKTLIFFLPAKVNIYYSAFSCNDDLYSKRYPQHRKRKHTHTHTVGKKFSSGKLITLISADFPARVPRALQQGYVSRKYFTSALRQQQLRWKLCETKLLRDATENNWVLCPVTSAVMQINRFRPENLLGKGRVRKVPIASNS